MGLTTDVLVIFLICKLCTASPINNGEVDVVSDINTILDAIANLTKNLKSVEETGNKALQQIKSNNKLLKGDFDLTVSQAQSFAVRLQIYEETRGRDISDCVDDFKLGLEQLSIDLTEYAKDCYNEAKDNVDDLIKEINMPNSTDIVDEVEEMFKNCDNIFCKQTTGEYGLLRVSEYKLMVEMYSLLSSAKATNIRILSSDCLLSLYENALVRGHKAAENFKKCSNSDAPIYNSDIDAVIDINTILEAIANLTKHLKSGEEIGNKTLQQIKRNNKLLKGDFDVAVSKAHIFGVRLQVYEETRGRDISDCVENLKSDLEQLSNDLKYFLKDLYSIAKIIVDNFIQDFDMPNSTDIVDEVEAMFKNCDNIFCKQTTGEYGLLRVSEYKLLVEMYSLLAREKGVFIRIYMSSYLLYKYENALDAGHKIVEKFQKCANSEFLPINKQ